MNIDIGTIVLHAITAVGIIEWTKKLWKLDKRWYALLLPVVAVGVGFSTLSPPVMTGLRVWAIAQLAYPLLVQLPERLIKGEKSE